MADEKETISRAEQRAKYLVEEGIEPPPLFASSIYPWGEIADAPGQKSFFVPVVPDPKIAKEDKTGEETARKKRAGIQTSGNNYYDKRGMDLQGLARVMTNDIGNGVKIWGVRCWAWPVEQDESQEEEELI